MLQLLLARSTARHAGLPLTRSGLYTPADYHHARGLEPHRDLSLHRSMLERQSPANLAAVCVEVSMSSQGGELQAATVLRVIQQATETCQFSTLNRPGARLMTHMLCALRHAYALS